MPTSSDVSGELSQYVFNVNLPSRNQAAQQPQNSVLTPDQKTRQIYFAVALLLVLVLLIVLIRKKQPTA